MFTDIWSKTRDLMEGSDIESVKAKTGNLEDIKKKAPEATKHVQGSVSKDKGTQAPAAKEGDLDDAVSHAPEAKKHVEGSVSTEKGTKAPAPKNGKWEDVKKKSADATKHVTMNEGMYEEGVYEEEEEVTTENVETSEPKAKGGKHWDIKLPHAADAQKHVHMGKESTAKVETEAKEITEGVKLGENFFAPMSENLDEYGDEHEMTRDDAEAQDKYGVKEDMYKEGIYEEGEMWDRDSSHRDTYGDTDYEDNWDDNSQEQDEFVVYVEKGGEMIPYSKYGYEEEAAGEVEKLKSIGVNARY